MAAEWLTSVTLVFHSSGAAVMSRLAQSTQLANLQLKSQQGLINANALAIERYRLKIDALRTRAIKFGNVIAGGIVIGGVAGMTDAVSEAAKLQQILLSIKNETGATNAQLGGFYNTAFDIANKNGMSVIAAAEVLRNISRLTAGQFDVGKMLKVAPAVAEYASLVHFNRPDISVEDATKTGISMAHLFRAYDPAALEKLLDKSYRLSGLMGEMPDQALRQMAYYEPMMKALGVSDEQSIATMALLDRAGFRNKVGTNVRAQVLQSLGPLQLTTHAQAGKLKILQDMGILDKNGKFAFNLPDGTLNYTGELAQIGKWEQAQIKAGVPRTTIAKEMYSAFGTQGGTIASLFGDAQMDKILKGISEYLKDPKVGMTAAKSNRDLGLDFQFGRAVQNLQSVMTELGYPWLRDLTGFFKGLGDNLHGLQAWLHGHRDQEKQIGEIFAAVTAWAGVRFAVGSVQMLIGAAKALGLLGSVTGLGAAAGGISLMARALNVLDAIFLAGMGGQIWNIATKFGILQGAVSGLSAIFGTAAVAGIPAAFSAIGAALSAIAGPLAVAAAAIVGFELLLGKSTAKEEGTVRPGGSADTYGTAPYWQKFAQEHGWNAVPHDVKANLQKLGLSTTGKPTSATTPPAPPAHLPTKVETAPAGPYRPQPGVLYTPKQMRDVPHTMPQVMPAIRHVHAYTTTNNNTQHISHLAPTRAVRTPARENVTQHHHDGSVTVNVTVNGGKDAHETARLTGAAVAHAISKQGLHSSLPTGSGMGHAARSAAH